MTTLLYTHAACLEHDPGPGHPESSARLSAILAALKAPQFAALQWREAPTATVEQLARIHTPAHIERTLSHIPRNGYQAIDGDTVVSPQSGTAALRAAGAVCAAVDAVLQGEANSAFCAIRPPGHHAEPNQAMGFCLFNNIAIGAAHARAVHGLERVAAIDFDVHHGNGTQAAFEHDPAYLYISTHQAYIYPGTGRRDERGINNIVNIPLLANSGTAELQHAWQEDIEPALRRFQPQLILISAGFDAHRLDPLAGLTFTETDYAWLTEQILAIAAEFAQGRVVSALEGGYNLSALAASTAAHVKALMQAD
ncbi:Histone deacetylase superfamily protein [Candidatus Competibacter denitrificans Run_A_D11]|uniref:Histone deacetylase superfamily protein n=1 Tax=Candidatus Competibacter denitrificans Run_A_D11 TaxID=1400863 RepID=W6M3U4_9GAMM|nr:histone deacetylase family protein [Candidatus Competibacter denitrificans]CDI01149.1 Histone deacetylase superfamily protein [Candidatus Competibacter denitrificans Run_A_D11]HRC69702.1 histone deacetylase family protein [Candidatus Competibacter denitrificans]